MAREMSVRTELYRLDEVFRFIEQGRLRIPNFQRPYVWTPQDMLDLLDSMDRGFPIGGVLIWRTEEQHDSLDKFGPMALPPKPEQERGSWMYLLDGHQRLATLFGVLKLGQEAPTDELDWWWWIDFDPSAERGRGRFFHAFPNGARLTSPPRQSIPMRYMLDSNSFLDWMDAQREEARALKRSGGKTPEGLLDPTQFVLAGQRLMSRLLNYKLPVYFVEDGDQQDATLIFERLNRHGVRLTEADLQGALIRDEGADDSVDLSANVRSAKEQLRAQRFETLSDNITLGALLITTAPAARFDGPATIPTQRAALAQHLSEGLAGLKSAAWFFRERLKLPGARWLPDMRLLLLFARRFALNDWMDHNSDEPALTELFWTLALSGLLDRLNDDERERLGEMITREAAGDRGVLPDYIKDLNPQRLPPQFAIQLVRVRAHLLIQLLHRTPLTLEDTPRPLELGLLEDQLEEHQGAIFSKADAGELHRDIGNQMWFRNTDTSLEGSIWLSQNARLIEDDAKRREVLASHAIDDVAWEALGRQDARAFIEARRAVLKRWEVDFLRERGLTRLADGLEGAS